MRHVYLDGELLGVLAESDASSIKQLDISIYMVDT